MAFSTSNDSDEVLSEINITPLVDVMLVLLVAFIVTAPLLTNAVRVNLPKTVATQPPPPQRHPSTVSVDAHGAVFLDKQPVSPEQLEPALKARLREDPQLTLHLSSDEAVNYGSVARVMALIERAGVTRVAVITATP